MTLIRLNDSRYLNLDFLVDAQIAGNPSQSTVVLKFLAPSPAGVGFSGWSVGPYEVVLKGPDALAAERWLRGRWKGDQPWDGTEPDYGDEGGGL